MVEKFILSTADYVVIGITLAVSAAIGLYFRFFGGQQKTNSEYLLAGKDMSIFPVSFSLMATFLSSTTLMGIPAEMYLFGTQMTFMNLGFILGPIISSFVFLPIYFKNDVSTAYEYLERRFGRNTRRILSGIFLLQSILFNAVNLYAPALALNAVTNLSIWTSVISITVVCTFNCTLGGIKAVIWADVFQAILMYVCLIAIIIKGVLDLGGIGNIFTTAYDDGRIILPTFEMNFSVRYTMWSIFLQGLIITASNFCGSQVHVQRQLTLKSLYRSRTATLLSIPMIVSFQLLCCLCGIIFYAYFKSCDPITSPSRPISSADQLMPYYVVSTMRDYPGLPGLCIAGIFSSSLSTISSTVNSMAAVTCEDIIPHFWPKLAGSVFLTKIASVFYGVLSALVTILAASMGNLVKASILALGMVLGPTLGVFLLASLSRTANEVGVNLGVLSGFIIGGCLTFIPDSSYYPTLPFEGNCSQESENISSLLTTSDVTFSEENFTTVSSVQKTANPTPPDNFPLSFMWISPISLIVCILIGFFGSCVLNYFQKTPKTAPPELLSPVRQWFCKNEEESNKVSRELKIF